MKAKQAPKMIQKQQLKIGIGLIVILGVWGGISIGQRIIRPAVTVLMTVQNQERTLASALDSIRGQTLIDWELIVVDRASDDKSSAILADYAARDPRIRVMTVPKDKKEHAALNKGLLSARGKYVALAAADSVNAPNRLARQVAFMEKEKLDLSAGSVRDPKNVPAVTAADTTDSDRLKAELIFENIFPASAGMVNRDFLNSKHLRFSTDHQNAEVYDLWLQVAAKDGRMGVLGGEPVAVQSPTVLSETESRKAHKSIRRARVRFVRRIVPDIRERAVDLNKCDLLPLLIEGNKETEIFDEKVLAGLELEACVPDLTFIAPDWRGRLAFIRGRRFRRADRPDDKATLTRNGRGIMVEWDHRPTEQYECNTVRCILSGYDPNP